MRENQLKGDAHKKHVILHFVNERDGKRDGKFAGKGGSPFNDAGKIKVEEPPDLLERLRHEKFDCLFSVPRKEQEQLVRQTIALAKEGYKEGFNALIYVVGNNYLNDKQVKELILDFVESSKSKTVFVRGETRENHMKILHGTGRVFEEEGKR